MARTRKNTQESVADSCTHYQTKPILRSESRENYLISLAYDLVEQRLKEGTATSQETTHFLKLGTRKEKLEEAILAEQKELLIAKREALESAKRVEELYSEAIAAFKSYNGFYDEDHEDALED